MLPRRIVFMGTPEFAAASLRALLAAGLTPSLVVTQPDRPAGRGHGLRESAVKSLALRGGLEVFQPVSLKAPDAQERLRAAGPDIVLVAAFGQILPKAVLEIPPHGCVNVHASLLPRHRGASPLAHAIWEGDSETGVCIMRMEAGLDTGPVFAREALPIPPDATTGTLDPLLAEVGARLLVRSLPGIVSGTLRAEPQDEARATVAPRLRREQGSLDFREGAARLERQVRAFLPWPICFVRLGGEEVKVLGAAVGGDAPPGAPPGTLLPKPSLAAVCGDGRLLHLTRVQRPGKRPVSADEFLRGFPIPPDGTPVLGGPP